ncbi:hypothetical protein GGD46_004525 [Rhizobium lusitanum]|uniref:Uncharacterized protein n=1 Tax=Rhizobium lusitanum TaxID=293958 RepID=A0A7X0ME26_9HYPH|nr:hypothetical protein [Rhizobium lusitanum]
MLGILSNRTVPGHAASSALNRRRYGYLSARLQSWAMSKAVTQFSRTVSAWLSKT